MNSTQRLKNKVCIVTGSSHGIGAGIAKVFAKEGAKVCVTYNTNKLKAENIASEIKADMVLQLEVSERRSVRELVNKVVSAYGRVDVLVNNAAISQEKPFKQITDSDWDRMMAVNLRGPFMFCQEVLPIMIKQKCGRIVNITSIGGQWGGFNQVHYAASKSGLINLTKSLAKIYSKHSITINAVAPGLVSTEMSKKELNTKAGKEKVANIPIGRIAMPEEVANVVAFLCSDYASYVTGQTLNVNGGMYFG